MIDASTLCLGCFEIAHVGYEPCPNCGWESSRQSRGMHLEPGQELHDRYILGRVLGQGGFGITYLGFDQTLNTKVAVKEYLYTTWASRLSGTISVQAHTGKEEDFASGVASFLAEARILAQFKQHHNIVTVTDFFNSNGTGYLVMDFEEGITFKQHLSNQTNGKLPWLQTLPIFIQVMDALRAAHNVNLIHRDISPDNIYLTKNGVVKVLDFGNARHFDAEKSQSFSAVLKEGYAPPEQYSRKGKQGPWTDVYSLGATMYNALTGEKPPQAMDRKEEDELKPIKSLIPDLPDSLAKLIHKALSLKASDRYQTIAEMLQVLSDIRRPPPTPTPPPPPLVSSRWKHPVYMISALLLTIAGVYYGRQIYSEQSEKTYPDVHSNPQPITTCPDISLNLQEIEIKSGKVIDELSKLNVNAINLEEAKKINSRDGEQLFGKAVAENKRKITQYKEDLAINLQKIYTEIRKDSTCIGKKLQHAKTELQANESIKAAQVSIKFLNAVTDIPANSSVTDSFFRELVNQQF